MRMLLAFAFFVAVVLVSFTAMQRSWNGQMFVYLGEERAPAAVRSLADYSEIKSGSLAMAAERQLLAEAAVEKREGHVGIHLGNPFLRQPGGSAGFACKVRGRGGLFDRVELTFVGLGVSVSGESAKMVVETPCEALQKPGAIDAIWIPMNDLRGAPPQDASYVFGEGDGQMQIQMLNMLEWPPQWSLISVRLLNRDDLNSTLAFSGEKLRAARADMLSFEW